MSLHIAYFQTKRPQESAYFFYYFELHIWLKILHHLSGVTNCRVSRDKLVTHGTRHDCVKRPYLGLLISLHFNHFFIQFDTVLINE